MTQRKVWINLRVGSSAIEVIRGYRNVVIRYRRKYGRKWMIGNQYILPIYFAKFLLRKDLLQKLGLVGDRP